MYVCRDVWTCTSFSSPLISLLSHDMPCHAMAFRVLKEAAHAADPLHVELVACAGCVEGTEAGACRLWRHLNRNMAPHFFHKTTKRIKQTSSSREHCIKPHLCNDVPRVDVAPLVVEHAAQVVHMLVTIVSPLQRAALCTAPPPPPRRHASPFRRAHPFPPLSSLRPASTNTGQRERTGAVSMQVAELWRSLLYAGE